MRCSKCGNKEIKGYKCKFCSLDDYVKDNLELKKYKDEEQKKLKKEASLAEWIAFLGMVLFILPQFVELSLYYPGNIEGDSNKIFEILENSGIFVIIISIVLYVKYYSHLGSVIKEIKSRLGI